MTDTIVLGIDGATWDILNPLITNGDLTNLSSLVDDGYTGVLESTFPPVTAPAWLSMATGQNPGKTGVFYFLNRSSSDSFEFEPMGAGDFRSRSFWDVLNAHGRAVGVFNFPMLYPPYDLDSGGFMVSGFGAPEEETLTAPASLQNELDDVTCGYEVKVPYADPKYADRPAALLRDLYRVLEKRETAIEYLLTEKVPDVFFGVISVTDWAQHYFWRYHDSDHVLYEPGYDDALADLFARVDETVGHIVEIATEANATLMVVSDHGFGPVNGTLYSNEWLEHEGFRVPTPESIGKKLRSRYFPHLRRVVKPMVSVIPVLSDFATSIGRSFRASPLENVDLERSIAFASEQGYTTGLIYMLNDNPDDRKRVVETLRDLCDTHDLSLAIYAPEDLYHGPKVELAPDVLFEVEGLEYAVSPRYSTVDEVVVEKPPMPARSGGHRREGIYIVAGPDVEPADGGERPLLDIAPTILGLESTPIPEEMDGDPMDEAFVNFHPVQRAPLADLVDQSDTDSRQDSDEVRDRLEDLGYL